MAKVLLGVGSNVDRERHVRAGVAALREHFPGLRASPVFESEAVGFDGAAFFNLVVEISTSLPVGELQRCLRELEFAFGRQPDQQKFSARTLDIDILVYDDLVGVHDGVLLPRPEILENAFVLWPLACLVPDGVHPVLQMRYEELWAAYDRQHQKLVMVEGVLV